MNSSPSLENENDDLEQVAGAIWADDQPSIGFLAEVVDDKSVRDGVGDVVVVDTVASSRSMDLHTLISYYEIQQGPACRGEVSERLHSSNTCVTKH